MARKARKSHRKARRSHRRSRRARKNPAFVPSYNPRKKHRRSRRRARRNPVMANPVKRHRRRRSYRKLTSRRVAKAWRTHRRTHLKASRRNIRQALNTRWPKRRRKSGRKGWRKHSRAKWNPALSLTGLSSSVGSVFSMEALYDGLAIGAGVVGALALPGLVQRLLPASISSKVNLTSGWTGYVANAVSAGLLGWAAGMVINKNVGRKVLLGGLGATVAKIALERIPGLSGRTGVALGSMGANPELSNLLAQEVASEMQNRGAMGAYLTPSQVVGAEQLGDYATPNQVANADSLGLYDATGEF